MVLIMKGVLWNGAFLVLFEVGFCASCPDISPECSAINFSNKTLLCNLEFIQDSCRTTCEIDGLDCSTPCSTFNYTGYEAFIFYAIGLFLLLVIGILSYSYFVDARQMPASLSRKKEVELADWPNKASESPMGIGSNPNIDFLNKIPSPSDDYGDEQRNRNEPYQQGSIFPEMKSEMMKRPSYKVLDSHPPQVAPISSYPASVMKASIRYGHELDEADGAEYLDEDDDFFKYALIPEDDSYHSDFAPPAPCRVGGPRQSQALSKKLKARDVANSKRSRGINSLPLQQEAHVEPRKKKRRNGAQQRRIAPNERCPSPKERHSSPSDHLSTPHRANKFPLNSSDDRVSERDSNVNRVNDTLHSLSDMGVEAERTSDLLGEPSEDPGGHKRLMVNQINSKKGWYALGQGPTRGHWGSCASEGMEPHDRPQKRQGHEGIEQERLPKVRGQEIQKVNEEHRRGKTNNSLPYSFTEGDADRGEPSPSPSIIKTDPEEKALEATGDDITFGKLRSSKTIEHTSHKGRDKIRDGEVIATSAVKG